MSLADKADYSLARFRSDCLVQIRDRLATSNKFDSLSRMYVNLRVYALHLNQLYKRLHRTWRKEGCSDFYEGEEFRKAPGLRVGQQRSYTLN